MLSISRRSDHRLAFVVAQLLFGLLAVGIGCSTVLTEPPLPVESVALSPPAQYQLWWRLTEECSGTMLPMDRVSWYVVPDARFLISAEGDSVQGLYYPISHHIVLAGQSLQSGRLVRHEMLHALIGQAGHPTEYFQERCGGIVACETTCIHDGSPRAPRDSTGPIMRSSALTLAARVEPSAPSMARDSGYFLLTVSATNPLPYGIRVRLTPVVPEYWASSTFGFEQSACSSPARYDGATYAYARDSILVLGPHETLRQGFDLRATNQCTLVRPTFNLDTLPSVRVQAIP